MLDRVRRIVILAASGAFAVALILHFQRLGGPYFQWPRTVQDHVAPVPYPSRDAIVLAERAAGILPRGTSVTALHPAEAPEYDQTLALAAAGLMPHHRVVKPHLTADAASRPRYVLAVRGEFRHPAYVLRMVLPEGRIYEAAP